MSAPTAHADGAVLYSRHGCSPCFAMRREAERAARRTGLPLRVVEISGDPALESRFGNEVPVLVLPGGETLRGRAAPGAVSEAFRRADGSPRVPDCRPDGPATARPHGSLMSGLMSVLARHWRPKR